MEYRKDPYHLCYAAAVALAQIEAGLKIGRAFAFYPVIQRVMRSWYDARCSSQPSSQGAHHALYRTSPASCNSHDRLVPSAPHPHCRLCPRS